VSGNRQVTYALDFRAGGPSDGKNETLSPLLPESVPRIARLMALAIRFDGLLRDQTIQDYAGLARRGRVTRARMTQIMKLLDLAPDIQEQILFLPFIKGLNERNLRPVVSRIDWHDQRRLFNKICGSDCPSTGSLRQCPPGFRQSRPRELQPHEKLNNQLACRPDKSDSCGVPGMRRDRKEATHERFHDRLR
jgi:hypothetical protein